jgi:hypothetical protein
MFHHIYRKFNLWLRGDRRAKWPRDLFELEECIYPYFLQAFDLNPETEYEKGRDILDACLDDAFKRLKGEGPKIEMTQSQTDL